MIVLKRASPWTIRAAHSRWRALRDLLVQFERLAQANVVIDLATTRGGEKLAQALLFEEEIAELQAALEREETRITVEGLHAGLQALMRKEAKKA